MVYGEHDAYNNELCMLYEIYYIVKLIKIGRLRWLGHLFRMQELDPCRKLTVLTPEVIQCVGKPEMKGLSQLRRSKENRNEDLEM